MEPLSAFSVACNVLQVIEVGAKTLNKVVEYRNASDGLLAEHRSLLNVARSLNNLNADLQASLPKAHGTNVLTAAETRLVEANNECLRISNDFIQLLDRLKVGQKSTILDALRISIKSLWHKEKVAAMEKSIGHARDNLNVSYLVLVNLRQSTLATQSELETHTTRLEGNILQAVAASSGYIHDDIRDLSSRLEQVNLGTVAQDVINRFLSDHHDFLQHLSTQLDSICAMNLTQQARKTEAGAQEAEHRIMASLHFPQMGHRKHQIHAPHERSFWWILSEGHPYEEPKWSNFLVWLRADDTSPNIYWIQGKPGSGKSSLVAFLDDNLDPARHMQPWAGHGQYVQASYYFWSSGDNILQKSMAGMMRSILYELLEQVPELLPRVVSHRQWRSARGNGTSINTWTDRELREMVHQCVKCIGESRKVLLFLDGLDEIEPGYLRCIGRRDSHRPKSGCSAEYQGLCVK